MAVCTLIFTIIDKDGKIKDSELNNSKYALNLIWYKVFRDRNFDLVLSFLNI
jgi:hypothetical protein